MSSLWGFVKCLFGFHDYIPSTRSDIQGELWTVYDYHCSRCGKARW